MNNKHLTIIGIVILTVVGIGVALALVLSGGDKKDNNQDEKTYEFKYSNFDALHSAIEEEYNFVWDIAQIPERSEYLWGLGYRLGRLGKQFAEGRGAAFRKNLKQNLFNGDESKMNATLQHIFGYQPNATQAAFRISFDKGATYASPYRTPQELWNATRAAFGINHNGWSTVGENLSRWRFFWYLGFWGYNQNTLIQEDESFSDAWIRLVYDGNHDRANQNLNVLLPQRNENINSAVATGWGNDNSRVAT